MGAKHFRIIVIGFSARLRKGFSGFKLYRMRRFRFLILSLSVLLLVSALNAERIRLGDLPKKSEEKDKKKAPPPDILSPEDKKKLVDEVSEEFYQRGLSAMRNGRLGQAEAYFDRVLVLQPGHAGAKRGLALIMQHYEKTDPPPAPKPSPTKPDPKLTLMEKLEKELDHRMTNGEWEEAEEAAAKILAVDPENGRVKQKTGTIRRNLFQRAVNRAEERERAGDTEGALDAYQLAWGYVKDGAIGEKIEKLKRQLAEAHEKKSEKFYLDALAATQNGKDEEAMRLCKLALSYNPRHIQARRMLDRLESRRR